MLLLTARNDFASLIAHMLHCFGVLVPAPVARVVLHSGVVSRLQFHLIRSSARSYTRVRSGMPGVL